MRVSVGLVLIGAAISFAWRDPYVWHPGPYHEPAMWTTWAAGVCIVLAAWLLSPSDEA